MTDLFLRPKFFSAASRGPGRDGHAAEKVLLHAMQEARPVRP
jgi:hypothetical protein